MVALYNLFEAAALAEDLSIGEINIKLFLHKGGVEVMGTARPKGTRELYRSIAHISIDEAHHKSIIEESIRTVDLHLKQEIERGYVPIDWPRFRERIKRIMEQQQLSFRKVGDQARVDYQVVHRLLTKDQKLGADDYGYLKLWADRQDGRGEGSSR